jgi:hypothetical protein
VGRDGRPGQQGRLADHQEDRGGPTLAPAEAPAAAAATATATGGVRVAAGDVNADSRPDIITALDKPLARGSVTLLAKAGQCVAGAHYPDAVLTTPQMRYEFKDVFITSCSLPSLGGGGGSSGVPTESISFNYAKIQWVTVKKPKEQ